jgi:hypothetical protein
MAAGRKIKAELGAADTWTDWIEPSSNNNISLGVRGTWDGTLHAQWRTKEPGTDTFTSPADTGDTFQENGLYPGITGAVGFQIRVGFKSGGYSSGTAEVYLAFTPK